MSGSLDRFYRRTTADIEDERRRLEYQGRALWNEATRSGKAAVGDTLSALRKLGSAETEPRRRTIAHPQTSKMMGRSYSQPGGGPATASGSPAAPTRYNPAPALASKPMGRSYMTPGKRPAAAARPTPSGERTAAALHGFSDGATFGAGDRVSALVHAGFPGDGHWSDRYHEQMEALRAQDAYDQAHYPMTRTAGQLAGAVMTAFTPFGVEAGALKAASYIPKAARFVRGATATKRIAPLARGLGDHARWSAITAGAGGGMGVGGQAVSDVAAGRRSSPRSYAAAAVGGATDGLWTVYLGPARGGALGGAVGAAADDAFNGRMPSLVRMSEGAASGSVMGKGLGALGTFRAHALPGLYKRKGIRKGPLGEAMSEVRSRLEGEGVVDRQAKTPVSRSYTMVDHVTGAGRPVEAKFGFEADLSRAQTLAWKELPAYRIDHFLPEDIGKLLALPFTSFSSGFESERRPR